MHHVPVCPQRYEDARLQAVLDLKILDTPAETRFDEIAELAAAACSAPTGLISIVESKRQWFKAKFGFSESETPIEDAVCFHALRQQGVLVIPDLTRDERTKRSRLVTGEMNARYYAGALIRGPKGHPVGTVCVIDRVARPAGQPAAQRATLLALARQASSLLCVRQALLAAS